MTAKRAAAKRRIRRKPTMAELSLCDALNIARPRFWPKVLVSSPDECWEWQAATYTCGYGAFSFRGKPVEAHRISVMMDGRDIPEGMWIDHICRNRLCVNPAHLRVVTPRINAIENSTAPTAINAAKTHCNRGHLLVRPDPDGPAMACKACAKYLHRCEYVPRPRKQPLQKCHCRYGHMQLPGSTRCYQCAWLARRGLHPHRQTAYTVEGVNW